MDEKTRIKKKICLGVVAHVDAGKTTCIESMLYLSGKIRRQGRVDHRDTVLDYDAEERKHGITIYAKDACFSWNGDDVFVIDTPGHVDFSSEMERVLSVLDMAIIVINGQDGVQSHTETIWKCLEHYDVPCLLFVNKMDISHHSKEELMQDLLKHCSGQCIDWENKEDALTMVNEEIMEDYLAGGELNTQLVQEAFARREFFPVLYGSALKNEGVEEMLNAVSFLAGDKVYPSAFGARVFRISNDKEGNRLTHVKVTGGVLEAKQKLGEEEKVDQIRFYTGENYEMAEKAEAGMICTLKGLVNTYPGQGLGDEADAEKPLLNGYLDYKLLLPEGADVLQLSDVCAALSAEDPQLMIDLDADHHSIHLRIMGEMQMEVLQKKIAERSGISVGFGTGGIVMAETVEDSVIGVGHFEPLRHYAEVVVRLEPLKRGSGVEVVSEVPRGMLSAVWEKSILSHLSREHKGVLTRAPLTDVRIVLVAAKGNLKHTSGGDFREAARRAVRQGLMKARNILLEPYYHFRITLPEMSLSRCLYELEQRDCRVMIGEMEGEFQSVEGDGPVRTLMNYQKDLSAYTKGRGRFFFELAGYQEVKNQEKIVEERGYDPESDLRNPVGSVFCANGAGYYVPWADVEKHMHIDLHKEEGSGGYRHVTMKVAEEDLDGILKSASGNNRNEKKHFVPKKKKDDEREHVEIKDMAKKDRLMVIDGYNCLYAWESMKQYKDDAVSIAREKLIDVIFAYQAYYKAPIQLVFDGYRRKDNSGSSMKRGELEVIYTRTDMTADAWIEKRVYELNGKVDLTVVTSDALIQNSVLAGGARRMSSRELENEIALKMHI